MATRKPTTRKPATPRTRTAKPKAAPVASEAAPKPAAAPRPRKTAKIIRNLRGVPVHLRLFSQNPKDPLRIALNPRGLQGDTSTVPVNLIDDITLIRAENVLVEVITNAEFKAIQDEYAPVGYLGRQDAPVIYRDADSTVMTAKDYDGKGRQVPTDRDIVRKALRGDDVPEREFGTGMHTADVPGSDTGLHAALKAGSSALPPEANFDRSRLVVERTKGE